MPESVTTGRSLQDDFEQARARHAGDVGALAQAQHDGGPDDELEVRPRVLPQVHDDERGLVVEPEERGEDDQHPEPESRDCEEQDRGRACHVVGQAVRAEGADDADGQPDHPRDQHGHEGDLGAERPAVQDQLRHLVAAEERPAEAAGRDVAHPARVLHGQRVAEPEVLHDPGAIAGGELREALQPEHGDERVARQDPQHDEDDQGHPDQGRDAEHRAAEQILSHPRRRAAPPGARA
jgi:hypothetical protein